MEDPLVDSLADRPCERLVDRDWVSGGVVVLETVALRSSVVVLVRRGLLVGGIVALYEGEAVGVGGGVMVVVRVGDVLDERVSRSDGEAVASDVGVNV